MREGNEGVGGCLERAKSMMELAGFPRKTVAGRQKKTPTGRSGLLCRQGERYFASGAGSAAGAAGASGTGAGAAGAAAGAGCAGRAGRAGAAEENRGLAGS